MRERREGNKRGGCEGGRENKRKERSGEDVRKRK